MNYQLLEGDCLDLMKDIPDGSVDMILCDLPYGTTACKWDSVIPFDALWANYKRVVKPNGAIVLTASQPFTTALIASNMGDFKYTWVWEKNRGSGFLDASRRPLKFHEDIVVFYKSQPVYNPIKTQGLPNNSTGVIGSKRSRKKSDIYFGNSDVVESDTSGQKFPKSIIRFDGISPTGGGRVHPTQKPVALMEYLIRTYTNEGETVLDNCMGSGTTGVACMNTGRKFIGIERDEKYFEIAKKRIEEASLPEWMR